MSDASVSCGATYEQLCELAQELAQATGALSLSEPIVAEELNDVERTYAADQECQWRTIKGRKVCIRADETATEAIERMKKTKSAKEKEKAVTDFLLSEGFPKDKILFDEDLQWVLEGDQTAVPGLQGEVQGMFNPRTGEMAFSRSALKSLNAYTAMGIAAHELNHAKWHAAGVPILRKAAERMGDLAPLGTVTNYSTQMWLIATDHLMAGNPQALGYGLTAVNETLAEYARTGKVPEGFYAELQQDAEAAWSKKVKGWKARGKVASHALEDQYRLPKPWTIYLDDKFNVVAPEEATLCKTHMPDGTVIFTKAGAQAYAEGRWVTIKGRRVLLPRITDLDKVAGGKEEIDVSAVFDNRALWPREYKDTVPTELEVAIADLVPTQDYFEVRTIREYMRGAGSFQDEPANVVKRGEEYLITDGHHRVAADFFQGKRHVKVRLVGVATGTKARPYADKDGGGRWVTINGKHVFIRGDKLEDLINNAKDGVTQGTAEVFRTGELTNQDGRGYFFGDSEASVEGYRDLHSNAPIKRYEVKFSKGKVTASQMSLHKELFTKTYQDAVWETDKRSGFKSTIVAARKVEAKMFRELRRRGFDAVIFTDPPKPAKHELAVFKREQITEAKLFSYDAEVAGRWVTIRGNPVFVRNKVPQQTSDVEVAAQAVKDGKRVDLPDIVAYTELLDHLADKDRSETYDLCHVSIGGHGVCAGNTGLTRGNMPQLRGASPRPGSLADKLPRVDGHVDISGSFISHLRTQGHKTESAALFAKEMRATQSEIDGKMVGRIAREMRSGSMRERVLFVSKDNYVVDGHHYWAAALATGQQLSVQRVDMGIKDLIVEAHKFADEYGLPRKALRRHADDTEVAVYYSPSQRRYPKGHPLGGQWMDEDARLDAFVEETDKDPEVQAAEEFIKERGDHRDDDGIMEVDPVTGERRYTARAAAENERIARSFLYDDAKPAAGVPPTATFVIGLPGAGKTSILKKLAGIPTSVTINPDEIKEAIPGYTNLMANAYHERSSDIGKMLTQIAVGQGYNAVFDATGKNCNKINSVAKNLRKLGYNVQVVYVAVDRETSLRRAYQRFKEGGRYVSLRFIREDYLPDSVAKSYNAVKSEATAWRHYDNSDFANPRLVEAGGQGITERQLAEEAASLRLLGRSVAARHGGGTQGERHLTGAEIVELFAGEDGRWVTYAKKPRADADKVGGHWITVKGHPVFVKDADTKFPKTTKEIEIAALKAIPDIKEIHILRAEIGRAGAYYYARGLFNNGTEFTTTPIETSRVGYLQWSTWIDRLKDAVAEQRKSRKKKYAEDEAVVLRVCMYAHVENFAELDKHLLWKEAQFLDFLCDGVYESQTQMVAYVESASQREILPEYVEKLDVLPNAEKIGKVIGEELVSIWKDGGRTAIDLIKEYGEEIFRRGGEVIDALPLTAAEIKDLLQELDELEMREFANPAAVEPTEAMEWLRAKTITVSGALTDQVLRDTKQVLLNAIKTGQSTRKTVEALREAYKPYLCTKRVKEEVFSRLENIVRTNLMDAYNHGRLTQFLDPRAVRMLEGVRYSATLDERTTDVCRFLDGKVFKPDRFELHALLPPNHFQCRSIVSPVVVGMYVDPNDWITPFQAKRAMELADQKFLTQVGVFSRYTERDAESFATKPKADDEADPDEDYDKMWGRVKDSEMTKDKEGYDGVWRTMRGRRVFIRLIDASFEDALERSLGLDKIDAGEQASKSIAKKIKYDASFATPERIKAARLWIDRSEAISADLVRNKGPKEQKAAVAKIDSLIKDAPALKSGLTVFRGMPMSDEYAEGTVFKSHGYSAASAAQQVARRFTTGREHGGNYLVTVQVPKGAKAFSVASFSAASGGKLGEGVKDDLSMLEAEVLLPRGSTFKVTNIDHKKRAATVTLVKVRGKK